MTRNNTTMPTEYPMPSTTDIELQIIADIVSEGSFMSTASERLTNDLFSDPMCLTAWQTLSGMYENREVIDYATFASRTNKKLIDRMIPKVCKSAVSELALLGHIDALVRGSARRKAYIAAIRILQAVNVPSTPTEELAALPKQLLDELTHATSCTQGARTIAAVCNDLGETIAAEQENFRNGLTARIPTGLEYLDRITLGGWEKGSLVILAARPSVGKTAMMLQFARTASTAGKAAEVFSLEMTESQLAQRLLLSTGQIRPSELAGNMNWESFERAAAQFNGAKIYLNDRARTLTDIRTRTLTDHRLGKADIVFIDYLSLIQDTAPVRVPLNQKIGEITRQLKLTAKDCGIPIVLLCQLNRASASENREPQLYDLRDSGNIEQDADIVLMLDRQDETTLNLFVRKNRQGKAGMCISLEPNQTYTSFAEREVTV